VSTISFNRIDRRETRRRSNDRGCISSRATLACPGAVEPGVRLAVLSEGFTPASGSVVDTTDGAPLARWFGRSTRRVDTSGSTPPTVLRSLGRAGLDVLPNDHPADPDAVNRLDL
jgi:hypothetical protein